MQYNNKWFLASLKASVTRSWKLKDMRLWKRLKTIALYLEGHNPQDICMTLDVSRRSIFYWMNRCNLRGIDGRREGQHVGRPMRLNQPQVDRLGEILPVVP